MRCEVRSERERWEREARRKTEARPEGLTATRAAAEERTGTGCTGHAAGSWNGRRRGPDRAAVAWLGAFSPQDGPAALVLALLVVVSYFPALQGGFVWDDVIFAEEPVIHSPGALRSIWFSPADIKNEGHYWPLVYTSFWLEHRLWGLQPAGYHAVNLFLHLLNCLLLWRLLRRLAVPGALLIAAVFAVHPLHVESVAWIIERKDLLSALFYLGAVLAWLRLVEAGRVGHYLLLALLFAAGLLSKSVVVTLPLALLIVQWWRGGRVTRLDLLRVAPLLVIGAAITAADLAFYRGREVLELGYTLAERMLIAGRALWFYAGKLVWPVELAVIYPLWEIDARSPAGWGYVVAAAGLALALWLLRERIGRGPLAGALYFALTLGPVLGFVDYGYMQFSFVADRFQYLAGIGVLAVLLGAAAHWVARLAAGEPAAAGERSRAGMHDPADEHAAAETAAAPAAAGWRWLQNGAWGVAAVVVVLLGSLTWRPGRHLPRRGSTVQPHRGAQPGGARRPPQPRQCVARSGPHRGRPCRQPHRGGAAAGVRRRVLQPRSRAVESGAVHGGRGVAAPCRRARPAPQERTAEHRGAAQEAGAVRGGGRGLPDGTGAGSQIRAGLCRNG